MDKDSSSVVITGASGLTIQGMMLPFAFRSTQDSSVIIPATKNDHDHNITGSRSMGQSQAMDAIHRSNVDEKLTGASCKIVGVMFPPKMIMLHLFLLLPLKLHVVNSNIVEASSDDDDGD